MSNTDDESDEEIIEYDTFHQKQQTNAQTQTEENYTVEKVITNKPKPTLGTPQQNCHTTCTAAETINQLKKHIEKDIGKSPSTTYKILTTINHTEDTSETLLYLNYHPSLTKENHEVINLTKEVTELSLHHDKHEQILEHWKDKYEHTKQVLRRKDQNQHPIDHKEIRKAEIRLQNLIRKLSRGRIIPLNWTFSYATHHIFTEQTTMYAFKFSRKHNDICQELRKAFTNNTREKDIDEWEKEIQATTHNPQTKYTNPNRMEAINKLATWLNTLNRPTFEEYYSLSIQPSTLRHRAVLLIAKIGGPLCPGRITRMRMRIKVTNNNITDETIEKWKDNITRTLIQEHDRTAEKLRKPPLNSHLNDSDDSDDYPQVEPQQHPPSPVLVGFQPLHNPNNPYHQPDDDGFPNDEDDLSGDDSSDDDDL